MGNGKGNANDHLNGDTADKPLWQFILSNLTEDSERDEGQEHKPRLGG